MMNEFTAPWGTRVITLRRVANARPAKFVHIGADYDVIVQQHREDLDSYTAVVNALGLQVSVGCKPTPREAVLALRTRLECMDQCVSTILCAGDEKCR